MILIAAWLLAIMQDAPHGAWALSPDSTIPIVVPNDVRDAAADLEYDDQDAIKGLIVDLNGDGNRDYILQSASSLCGTNCVYLVLDGKNHRRVGQFVGARIQVGRQRVRGYPVISVLSYEGAQRATLSTFKYDGRSYSLSGKQIAVGPQLDALVKQLSATKLWRP